MEDVRCAVSGPCHVGLIGAVDGRHSELFAGRNDIRAKKRFWMDSSEAVPSSACDVM